MIGDNGEVALLLFDVDGTVCQSAQTMTNDMAFILSQLIPRLGFISGTGQRELERMLSPLTESGRPFYLMPEMGRACFSGGNLLYDHGTRFSSALFARLELYGMMAMNELGILPVAHDVFQRRHSQVTISILGRSAPPDMKAKADPTGSLRHKIIHRIVQLMKQAEEPHIPEFCLGGSSSIDIQETPWDKRDGVNALLTYLDQPPDAVIFFGDNIKPGGNDWPVTYTGVECRAVKCPADTLGHLRRR